MRRSILLASAVALLFAGLAPAQDFDGPAPGGSRFESFAAVTKGAKEYDGFLKLYQKDDKVYAEIQPHQFNVPMLCPIAIAKGAGQGGSTLNFDEQWVLVFKRVGDKVHLVRRNVRFQARSGTPVGRAVDTTYTDSILLALRIVTINPMRQAALINLNDIFMSNFAEAPLGMFDPSRSVWHKVKAFPNNVELEVAATFVGGRDPSVIDRRGKTVVMHYGLCAMPDSGYTPRIADDRVGHFLTARKDFSTTNPDTTFVRYINRWRLERADAVDPKNPEKLSDPQKKIVYWIEKSVPTEYRAAVREGILEWNKAFEKCGFRDAIEVRQQESEEFDPEDIHYNTFRWIATDRGFAMGPSRANPLTGEIIDADIVFDASMVRFWQQEANLYRGKTPASLIEATKRGWGLDEAVTPADDDSKPQGWNQPRLADQDRHAAAGRLGLCQCGAQMKYEMGLAAMAVAARVPAGKGTGDKENDELIRQAIKYVTMHEVGHTLGLRHNFKASTMLKAEQLHDTKLTREKGLVGSVMDYTPVNLAPKGVKQGDYFSTTLGPYDYWAIEYAYKPDLNGEQLKELAKKCAAAGLDYATDEDMRGSDPHVHVWDLGSDPLKFAQERAAVADEMMKGLAERVVEKGEGYQRARTAFRVLLNQYGNAAYLASNFVGGEFVHRDHRDDPNGRDPLVPVKGDKQREALKFLQENVLNDAKFQFPPKLLRQLAADRWNHWGAGSEGELGVYDEVLKIQRVVLRNLLDADVLTRIQANAMKSEKDDKPLAMAEVFRTLTDGVWSDLGADAVPNSVIRRNLQREHLKDLSALVLDKKAGGSDFFVIFFGGPSAGTPPDARSLARAHLKEVHAKIGKLVKDDAKPLDATTRAHLDECHERIGKVLNASMTLGE